jgi:hypothetical protein
MGAEYEACGAATREALSLLREFALLCPVLWPEKASVILCVNKAAVSLYSDCKEAKQAKHNDIVHHFARDHVATGDVKLVYGKSEDNLTVSLTLCPGVCLNLDWMDWVCCNDLIVLELSLVSTGECRNAR